MSWPLAELHARAPDRPAGYVDRVLAAAERVTDTHYHIRYDRYLAFWREFRGDEPPPVPPRAVPRDLWPFAARAMRRLAKDGDTGVGDVVQRLAARAGGESFKRWYGKLTGEDCGCIDRQSRLNLMFPFE